MIRTILFLLSVLGTVHHLFAQKEAGNWFFGNYAGLTWNITRTVTATPIGTTSSVGLEGMPTVLSGSRLTTGEGCFCVSDAGGNLLFYSDGITIWKKDHSIMANNLSGHSSSAQSGIVIPNPGHSGQYLAVTLGQFLANNLSYTIVDMDLSGGLGDVVPGAVNIPFAGNLGKTGESVSSIRHINGEDYWVVAPGRGNPTYFNAWLVTKDGVSSVPVITQSPVAINTSTVCGYLKFSPDGNYFAWATSDAGRVIFGEFDIATGEVKNIKSISNYSGDQRTYIYGIEFSASGENLYVTSSSGRLSLWVYKLKDLMAASDPNSVTKLTYLSAGDGAIQLAPDGRIYLANATNQKRLWVIDNPEDYNNLNIYLLPADFLGSGICRIGLPSFSSSWFSSGIEGPSEFCINTEQTFSLKVEQGQNNISRIIWDFGDEAPGSVVTIQNVTSGSQNLSYTFTRPGIYSVSAISYNSTGVELNKKQKQVRVNPCVLPVNQHIRIYNKK